MEAGIAHYADTGPTCASLWAGIRDTFLPMPDMVIELNVYRF
jgi:hypothetical protein